MGSLITASLDGNAVTYSTHMSYGSVFAYGLSLLFGTFLFAGNSSEIVSLNVCFVLLGLLGGILVQSAARAIRLFNSHDYLDVVVCLD